MIDSSNFQCHKIFFFWHTKIPIKYFLSPLIFGNSIATILFFFFSFHFGNSIVTNQLPPFFFFFFSFFSSNPLPKLLLNSSPTFRQLGCHNSYFLSPHSPTISATWLPQLVFSLLGTSPSTSLG